MSSPSPDLGDRVRNELLPGVTQPAQYIGGEVNQLPRPGDWQAADVRVALAFPDAYTIGMSHLGSLILYWLCNHTPGVCAERVYAPWPDAEAIMRRQRLPLFTWDTHQPVATADLFAVSLQYELCASNLLNMLDLAGIPLRAAERTDDHPLVLAGGPQADNPEPFADFLDLVIIGDGEPAMAALLAAIREYKQAGVRRREMLPLLARRFPWLYVPSLYTPRYNSDGTLADLVPQGDDLPTTIARCHSTDFEHDPVPTRPLIPWVPAVHERIAVEIMRGCPNVCRFCHAGYTKRPLKLRTPERIVDLVEQTYRATGYDEIALLSLSTSDYPRLKELAAALNARFTPRHVNLSLPSLRVDRMLADLPDLAAEVRKGSLTIAAEAARDGLRRALRKKVADVDLMEGVRAAYAAGWKRVKLYFMAGFPGETDDDIRGIWELAYAVSQERRTAGKPPAAVTASVSWLVPKPFTPLQWAAQPTLDYFKHVQDILFDMCRAKRSAVRIRTHDPRVSVLEAVISRGDRRLGPALLDAWRRGARFDTWSDHFRHDVWTEAFEATGVDPAFYAHRERPFSERLPWDHIGQHMSRCFLERAYQDVFVQLGQSA